MMIHKKIRLYKSGKIEVLDKDFGLINWAVGNNIIKNLNHFWKLPSKEGFLILYKKEIVTTS